jgi:hypothetical protein
VERTRCRVVQHCKRYPDTSHAAIAALAAEELEKISNSKVTDYFAVLTERAVRKRLKR